MTHGPSWLTELAYVYPHTAARLRAAWAVKDNREILARQTLRSVMAYGEMNEGRLKQEALDAETRIMRQSAHAGDGVNYKLRQVCQV